MFGNHVLHLARFASVCLIGLAAAILLPGAASAQDGGWVIEPKARVETTAISAQTATRDEQIVVAGDALTFRIQGGADIKDDNTRFRLQADRIEVVRLGEGRSNSNRDRFTAQFDQELSDALDIQVRGRYYDDLITVESSDTDELQGSVRVSYQPSRAHRFQLRGSWRDREYANRRGPETFGEGPRVDAQYRHRLGRYHYITFDLRAESISSDDPRRGHSRESAKVAYTQPITRDLRVRPAIELLKTRFDDRLAPDGEQRADELIAPELEVMWWPGPWRVEGEAKYIFSNSNLPSRDREGYRLTLTVGYVF
ncbi:hypothetical protein [Erythrobacter ani]|uniref:DUF481 domain-containing protein n=1 Tax=Erythrobacter ani TaxID=2827235 RepID=A0ABS6SL11_9SPHN|nr:hypothetical protein [Erythrobacter ani]MBV7265329.1 hypothetical protein [Erythrobacter ani]